MSTNLYIKLTDENDNSTLLHIGKVSRSAPDVYGLSTVSGRHFPTVASIVEFLRWNDTTATVVNEYGIEYDTEKFIKDFLEDDAPTSATQIRWIRDHQGNPKYNLAGSLDIWEKPQNPGLGARHWIDEATGKLFYSGWFC